MNHQSQKENEQKIEERRRLILESRARMAARRPSEADVERDALHLLELILGKERYGIDIALVQEVQPLTAGTWARVPCTPEFIVGVVNIRGRIHSVMDLARLFGLPQQPLVTSTHVVLVKNSMEDNESGMELCIVADDLPQVVTVPKLQIQPAPSTVPTSAQEYVRGVTSSMLVILDLERLLRDPLVVVHEDV